MTLILSLLLFFAAFGGNAVNSRSPFRFINFDAPVVVAVDFTDGADSAADFFNEDDLAETDKFDSATNFFEEFDLAETDKFDSAANFFEEDDLAGTGKFDSAASFFEEFDLAET